MPDSIGRISVPEVAASGTFPLVTDYPHQRRTFRRVETHRFGSGEGKIEQRFLLGPAVTKYWFQKSLCEVADRAALLAFWEARQGSYQPFTYNAPGDAHGDAATAKTVRFDEPVLTLEHLEMECSAGFWLAELPPAAPAYAVTSTVERFPDATLSTALTAQEHELIPLLRIRVNEAAVPDITISDRRCVVDGTLYQARLLTFAGVSQAIDGQADDAVFELGNADGVMRACAADTNLRRALVEFSLYHVGSETVINLWAGRVLADGGWEGETSAVFHLRCSDPIAALNLPYPRRTFSRRCWKRFNDGLNCPYTSVGSLNGSYPSASAGSCDKGWETANGCRAHNMDSYHGGIQQSPQRARIKMPNTGFGFGFGRRSGTVASIIDETVFHGAVVPEVWTNLTTAVQGLIVAARDESEFYDALAVVSEGPIGAFGSGHRLDGQTHHGPGSLGLRTSLGPNPNTEAFGITGSGDPTPAERAAGTAFIELRRTDAEGIQLTQAEEHSFVAIVSQGLAGWKWTSGTRSSVAGMANPVWVAVNAFLRHLRLEGASAAAQAALFDVAAAETAAGYCDASVAKIVGSGSTTQFTFRGSISEQKPFRDWLTEILANCLGYFTFKFGKLRIGTRLDSVSVEAYTIGNVLFDSLRLTAFPVEATRFVAHFGERLLDAAGVPTTQAENVTAEDEDAAIELGGGAEPLYLEASRNFVGTDTRDQAARLATTRLREMTGGVTAQERARARTASWETTVLGLESEPGQVIGFTDAQIPGGAAEFRVQSWELLPDMRIVMRAKQSYDSMYDLTLGSTAADVEPDALPTESTPELDAQPVTNFDAEEDPAGSVDPNTGQTQSSVSVSYDEPVPVGVFAGVAIWAQHYDGTDVGSPGSPVAEPWLVTKIPVNALPEARLLPPLETTGKVLRVGAVEYSDLREGRLTWGVTPSDYVLLDGKDSPPSEPANEWAQTVAGGIDLSAERNPEPDVDEYLIAFTGDREPWSLDTEDAAIKDSQIIGSVKARDVSGERWHWLYTEKTYGGTIDATQTHIDLPAGAAEWIASQWLVETTDGGFEGVNVQILAATVANYRVTANTAERLTFATGTLPAPGKVQFRIRGAAGEGFFYAAAMDKSGNRSNWGEFPPAEALGRDGTTDSIPPNVFGGPQLFGDGIPSIFTTGFGMSVLYGGNSATDWSGLVGLLIVARAADESETDPELARMNGIRGIVKARITIEYSTSGSAPFDTLQVEKTVAGRYFNHNSGLTGDFWTTAMLLDPIPLQGAGINSLKVELMNGLGVWGPQVSIGAQFLSYPGLPVWTGNPNQIMRLTPEGTSGTIAINPHKGGRRLHGPLTGALTIAFPSPAPDVGQEWEYEIRQPAAAGEGYQVSLAAGFKDYPADLPRVGGTKIMLRFRADSSSVARCVKYDVLPYQT